MKILVFAKAPVAGMVKTRLCPPLDHQQAAAVAEACLRDTLEAVLASDADERILLLEGPPGPWLPAGFRVLPQRGADLADRLTAAWQDGGGPAVQIGMDTPQVSAEMLNAAMSTLESSPRGAVLGPAEDGGWWAIGLLGADRRVFAGVPMSTSDTGAMQRAALAKIGRDPALLPTLRDVDSWDDAVAVAGICPPGRYSALIQQLGGTPQNFTSGGGVSRP